MCKHTVNVFEQSQEGVSCGRLEFLPPQEQMYWEKWCDSGYTVTPMCWFGSRVTRFCEIPNVSLGFSKSPTCQDAPTTQIYLGYKWTNSIHAKIAIIVIILVILVGGGNRRSGRVAPVHVKVQTYATRKCAHTLISSPSSSDLHARASRKRCQSNRAGAEKRDKHFIFFFFIILAKDFFRHWHKELSE